MTTHPTALLLDDFEHDDLEKYGTNHHFVSSYQLSLSTKQAKFGHHSLRLSYDFSGWLTGNGAMYIRFQEKLQTERRPETFGLWMFGDGNFPWMRATFIDGTGSWKTVNLTDGNIDWHGWKYVDAKIDKAWTLPIRLEQIYAVETDTSLQGRRDIQGEIYIDYLRFVYHDKEDLKGPLFHDIVPENDRIYQDTFTFSAKVTDDKSGVNYDAIQMAVNNESVTPTFCEATGELRYQLQNLAEGMYQITVSAEDNAGNVSLPGIDKTFVVDLSPDTESPFITNMTPRDVTVYTRTPRISCQVIDEKSGVDEKDIIMTLNGKQLNVTYDEQSGWCYAYQDDPLPNGVHHIIIKSKDRAGNETEPLKATVTVQAVPDPVESKVIQIPVIPDTHSPEYAALLFKQATQEEADVMIHMGDLVDQGTEAEFVEIAGLLEKVTELPILKAAGNHEAFQGHLKFFHQYVGSPTYHLDYGPLRIIVLNSALNESISESDATQFHYLQHVLKANTKKQVLIVTHVPVKDPFDTAHEMKKTDADQLEQVLSHYKSEHPHVQLTVLFGHLHVVKTWQKNGINYIIAGNGAQKGYVPHEYGNLLGYGMLTVSCQGMKYNFKPFLEKMKIYIKNNDARYFKLKQGTSTQLNISGKIKALKTCYATDLTDRKEIETTWLTSNRDVASVSVSGKMVAKREGTAMITANIASAYGIKQAQIHVHVVP